MELPQVEIIQKIAKKIKSDNNEDKIEIAKEINELAKTIIDLYRSEKCQTQ